MGRTTRKFSTSKFTWNKDSKTFIAEASTLGLTQMPDFLSLTSHVTGKVLTFPLGDSTRDREGDTVSWTYGSGDIRVTIFNT